MDERVQGIEEVKNKGRSGEVTDSAREAIMQAAMNKAGGNDIETAEAASAAQAQQIQETQNATQKAEAEAKEAEKINPERQQATEKMLTGSVDMMALNNLNNLGIKNPTQNAQVQNFLNDSMMQAAMNKSNPATSREANKNMANVSQGTTEVSDTAKKDAQKIDSQQEKISGASEKMLEAKDSGLSMGVRIEAPDKLEKHNSPEKLLAGSMEQLAMNNRNSHLTASKA